jgi:mRNA interferase MazF
LDVTGVVLSDQVRSLDWQSRQAAFLCPAPDALLAEVLEKLRTLI